MTVKTDQLFRAGYRPALANTRQMMITSKTGSKIDTNDGTVCFFKPQICTDMSFAFFINVF